MRAPAPAPSAPPPSAPASRLLRPPDAQPRARIAARLNEDAILIIPCCMEVNVRPLDPTAYKGLHRPSPFGNDPGSLEDGPQLSDMAGEIRRVPEVPQFDGALAPRRTDAAHPDLLSVVPGLDAELGRRKCLLEPLDDLIVRHDTNLSNRPSYSDWEA